MRSHLTALAILLTLAGTAMAEPDSLTSEQRPNLLAFSEEEALQLPPVLREVRDVFLVEAAARRVLDEELSAAINAQHIHQLEGQMAALALATEVSILEIQAKHMRLAGRTNEAEVLAANAAELRQPKTRSVAESVPQRKAVQK